MRLLVSITGASGAVYGIRLLEVLKKKNIETHLVVTKTAERIIRCETKRSVSQVKRLANHCYDENNLGAPIASGSFRFSGMVIIPCSMKTLAGVASGFTNNLVLRAADVALKEHRMLILVPRETPLNVIHLRNMLRLAATGVTILPPMPAFYNSPKTVDDIVNHIVGKVLDQLLIEHELYERWSSPNVRRRES